MSRSVQAHPPIQGHDYNPQSCNIGASDFAGGKGLFRAGVAEVLDSRRSACPVQAVLATIAIVRVGHGANCRLMFKGDAVDESPQPPTA